MSQQKYSVKSGSAASASDLDWSQIRETVKMLNLAIAQVGGSQKNGDASVSTLTDSITFMAQLVSEIRTILEQEKNTENHRLLESIDVKCQLLSDKVQNAIIAFQFYDRLSQKLTHVSQSLTWLGDLVSNQSWIYNPREWMSLQQDIRSHYTMQEERGMFDLILKGASVEEVLASRIQKSEEQETGEIELF